MNGNRLHREQGKAKSRLVQIPIHQDFSGGKENQNGLRIQKIKSVLFLT